MYLFPTTPTSYIYTYRVIEKVTHYSKNFVVFFLYLTKIIKLTIELDIIRKLLFVKEK